MTVAAAAKRLGLSRQRVYVLVRQRGIDISRGLSAADLAQLRDRQTGAPKGNQNARKHPRQTR